MGDAVPSPPPFGPPGEGKDDAPASGEGDSHAAGFWAGVGAGGVVVLYIIYRVGKGRIASLWARFNARLIRNVGQKNFFLQRLLLTVGELVSHIVVLVLTGGAFWYLDTHRDEFPPLLSILVLLGAVLVVSVVLLLGFAMIAPLEFAPRLSFVAVAHLTPTPDWSRAPYKNPSVTYGVETADEASRLVEFLVRLGDVVTSVRFFNSSVCTCTVFCGLFPIIDYFLEPDTIPALLIFVLHAVMQLGWTSLWRVGEWRDDRDPGFQPLPWMTFSSPETHRSSMSWFTVWRLMQCLFVSTFWVSLSNRYTSDDVIVIPVFGALTAWSLFTILAASMDLHTLDNLCCCCCRRPNPEWDNRWQLIPNGVLPPATTTITPAVSLPHFAPSSSSADGPVSGYYQGSTSGLSDSS